MFINIIIKSKNKTSLKLFIQIFKIFSKKLKINHKLKITKKNQKIKRFTILKSPHVNKTAQDIFEFRVFTQNLTIKNFKILKTILILKQIQNNFLSDVNVKFKFNIKSNLQLKTLNKNFKTKFSSKILYLNFYGKNNLTRSLNSSVGRAKD